MIMVTGANGFVGKALVIRLADERSFNGVVATVRLNSGSWPESVCPVKVGDLSATTDWGFALLGVKGVIHCAARVHLFDDMRSAPLEAYRQVNVEGTLNLARQAAQAGVSKFVFVSSIKVNGEASLVGTPFTANDVPSPSDNYSLSKLEAEQGLRKIEAETGMAVVVVRPPLVYGPKVKANFASMMRFVASGIPLPLGAINNARSFVALDNLVDLLVTCLKHPGADGQTFLVSDGEDVSTTLLLRHIAKVMNKKLILFSVPVFLLELGAAFLGKREVAHRLCGNLQVDITKTCSQLNWTPPFTLSQGLKKAVEDMICEKVI